MRAVLQELRLRDMRPSRTVRSVPERRLPSTARGVPPNDP